MARSINIYKDELIEDLKIGFNRYKFYLLTFLGTLVMLVAYSQLNYNIDSQIVQLNQEKNYLIAENFRLKKDIALLSSPERISEIAIKQQGMKTVNYKNIKFIEVNP